MIRLMGNSKGTDKIISVYWFVILFIVAAAVVYMVYAFYGKPYDIRNLEADALTGKTASCFSQSGYLRGDAFTENLKNNLLKECGLDFKTEDSFGWKNDQLYLEVNILDFSSKNQVATFQQGNAVLKDSCNLKGKSMPVCLERKIYVLDKQKNQYQINIISIVRKTEKNVQ